VTLHMTIAYQEWPYRQTFRYARATQVSSPLFLCHITDGEYVGRGECGLQTLKHETRESIGAELAAIAARIGDIGSREALNRLVPGGSARNAVDCAFWDLECKRMGRSIWEMANVALQERIEVDITIGINPLEKMRADAVEAARKGYGLLKIKADAESVLEKIAVIAEAAKGAMFIVDANEAWTMEQLIELAPRLKDLGVVVIEQPLHHARDDALETYRSPIPLCADESCATSDGLDVLARRYQAVNIKLDKCGGLTEGLALARAARARGLGLMMGCNGATSLGNAPAYVIGTLCDWRDIDSHALLYEDRFGGMKTENGKLYAFSSNLWG